MRFLIREDIVRGTPEGIAVLIQVHLIDEEEALKIMFEEHQFDKATKVKEMVNPELMELVRKLELKAKGK
jgi:hypothetical protein